ncbi:MAG: hypothetical protein JW733_02365 [Coriobacteriia bacterium]|nr:hypothetical protein [Coriobacteriia bacterium]MBN2839506.1 hypothetical protein [Coriobacteriia bacterium]
MMHDVRQDESLGIRLYEVNRQRAVDRAIERTRYALGADWHYLTTDDHDTLRWITGELWATTARDEWETFRFSKLDLRAVQRLVSIGDRLRRHRTGRASALENAAGVVRSEQTRLAREPVTEEGQSYFA